MLKTIKKIFVLFLISFSLFSLIFQVACSKKKEEEPSNTIYSTLTTVNSSDTSQNTTINLKDVATCTKDSTSGLVTIRLGTSGVTAPFLGLSIRGYNSTTAATYTCTQDSLNTSEGSVGSDLYQSCAIQVGLYSDTSGSYLNQYSMYRPVATIGSFDYATNGGVCSITVTEASPTIKGTISCTKMIQSYYHGNPRNPAVSSLYVDLSGNFYCTFGTTTTSSKLSEDFNLAPVSEENIEQNVEPDADQRMDQDTDQSWEGP